MKAFLILSIDRRNTISEAEEVIDLAITHRAQGIVGVDLCGDPAKGDIRIFAPAFRRAKAAGLKITLHFAETEGSGREEELSELLAWEPERLGHVIHVPEKFQEVIRERNIGLELCLSCNVSAKMVTGGYGEHHFGMWWGSGACVALSVSYACSIFFSISDSALMWFGCLSMWLTTMADGRCGSLL